MKRSIKFIKNHVIAVICYILYTLLCIDFINLELRIQETIRRHPGISGIAAGGEGVGWYGFFLLIISGIYFLINCGFAIGSKKDASFYLWLCLIIVVQTIAVFNIRI